MSSQRIRLRILTAVACSLLIVGIAAGCSSSKSKSSDSASTNTTDVANEQTGTTSGQTETPQADDSTSPGSNAGDDKSPSSVPDGVVPSSPDASQPIEKKVWTLDTAASEPVIDSVMPVLIQFDKDKVTGNGGCNSFNGALSIDGRNITIKDISISGIPCGLEEDEATEQVFLNELKSVKFIDAEAERVVLTTENGKLVFTLFGTTQ